MTHLWQPDQTIEPFLALELIQEQFPLLNANQIRLLGAGWDNTAFVINEEIIFRFPRRKIALPLLETETELLPKLKKQLPLPIPFPEWIGKASSKFPYPFIGYRMLPGVTACYANLKEDERAKLAIPIAHFLSTLHAVSPQVMGNWEIKQDNLSRINGHLLIPRLQKNLDELSLLNLLKNRKQIELAIEQASSHFREPKATSLVHGDFYIRHMLVDEKHNLCGIIDWGDIHVGDPAIDLSIMFSFLPLKAHDQFIKTYGLISQETLSLAKVRAIFSSTYLLLFGHHTNDPDLVREGSFSLEQICR